MLLSRHLSAGLSAVALLGVAVAQKGNDWIPFDTKDFTGNTTLDENGDVHLFWKIGDKYSTYGIASKSSGYLAVGFSETGAMTGADIAVGYMDDDDKFVLENRHAKGFVSPELSADQENNIRLKDGSGSQKDGVTAFVFEKKNDADCLEEQVKVATDAWQWFIYSHSEDNTFAQHKPGANGKKYIKLGTGKTVSVNEALAIPNTQNFTIKQPEVAIPTDETNYCYSMHKMPKGKKNFLLGERPTRSSDLLHHLVVYACYGLTDKDLEMLDKGSTCEKNFSNPCNGFVTEWAPGMSGRTFEKGFGKPFGEDYYEYVMFETHYNNPKGIKGEKDSAEFTLLWNDEPVDTEIGTLTLGDLQLFGWELEPGKKSVKKQTVCTPECTKNWPKEGVTAFSVFHHMHFRGRNTQVQIIRDGKEIEPLSTLRGFEYGYQFSKNLNQVQLLPGDKFITTCDFDTTKDTKPAKGGMGSQDEMCFAWVDYYPANSVLACTQMDLGEEAANPINGTVGFCMDKDNNKTQIYPSKELTSKFATFDLGGNTCSASNSTEGESGDSGSKDDSKDGESGNSGEGDGGDSAAMGTFLFEWKFLALPLALVFVL